jgi:hypothetical protein
MRCNFRRIPPLGALLAVPSLLEPLRMCPLRTAARDVSSVFRRRPGTQRCLGSAFPAVGGSSLSDVDTCVSPPMTRQRPGWLLPFGVSAAPVRLPLLLMSKFTFCLLWRLAGLRSHSHFATDGRELWMSLCGGKLPFKIRNYSQTKAVLVHNAPSWLILKLLVSDILLSDSLM